MDEGISIIKCQETHSHDPHETANYLAHLDNITVFESINTSNPNKGGLHLYHWINHSTLGSSPNETTGAQDGS